MYLACIMVYIEICIESVFAHYNSIRMQYQQNIYQYRQVCIEYIPVSIEYMLVCIQYIPPIHTTTDATIHTNIVHVLAITDGANTVFQSLSSCKRLIQIVCSKICWELQCCFIMGEEKIKLIFCHMSPEWGFNAKLEWAISVRPQRILEQHRRGNLSQHASQP